MRFFRREDHMNFSSGCDSRCIRFCTCVSRNIFQRAIVSSFLPDCFRSRESMYMYDPVLSGGVITFALMARCSSEFSLFSTIPDMSAQSVTSVSVLLHSDQTVTKSIMKLHSSVLPQDSS